MFSETFLPTYLGYFFGEGISPHRLILVKVFHRGSETVGIKFCHVSNSWLQGVLQRKGCREYAQCTWASCDAMEPVGRPRGFRARWRARGAASEVGTELDGDGAQDWEEVGLEDEGPPEAKEPVVSQTEEEVRQRLGVIDAQLQQAVEHVTPEELEAYWTALPAKIKELVTLKGEVSADLLAYIADTDEDRMNILRECGCPEHDVAEKAIILEALQMAAEEKAARLRRNRIFQERCPDGVGSDSQGQGKEAARRWRPPGRGAANQVMAGKALRCDSAPSEEEVY